MLLFIKFNWTRALYRCVHSYRCVSVYYLRSGVEQEEPAIDVHTEAGRLVFVVAEEFDFLCGDKTFAQILVSTYSTVFQDTSTILFLYVMQ